MKKKKYNVGLTFGAYDCCHRGHINLLENAKKQCNKLVVCISTDDYIRKVKNAEPIIMLEDRLANVEAIRYVDIVDVQSLQFGKKEAVAKYHPDVLFVGADWNKHTYTGMNLGITVVFLPHTQGISSTMIRDRLLNTKKK